MFDFNKTQTKNKKKKKKTRFEKLDKAKITHAISFQCSVFQPTET
ncbi:hypothetical protein EcB7A_2579 [Escherichia coli B7A]|nr:hypothetical protein EcB7A_2579 [Escherichia coli B7A]